ncbi:hypothetical protein BDR06DRAFT_975818 [Suillus hirtellus]|nr:hypothetical protein BDR06DRAFT_977763 [Suillus hirtellus]KAG2048737.1 hypothetical protein BDR06DRAFT_975818 [Suillus hirtellus]
MPQKAKEWMRYIKDGETLTPDLKPSLTPDLEPSMPPNLPTSNLTQPVNICDLKPSLTPNLKPSLTPDLEPSMPPNLLTPNSTQLANICVASSEPYMYPSSIIDEMMDPTLCALDHVTSHSTYAYSSANSW